MHVGGLDAVEKLERHHERAVRLAQRVDDRGDEEEQRRARHRRDRGLGAERRVRHLDSRGGAGHATTSKVVGD